MPLIIQALSFLLKEIREYFLFYLSEGDVQSSRNVERDIEA